MSVCIYVLVVLLASVLFCGMLVQCWSCLAVLFCYIYITTTTAAIMIVMINSRSRNGNGSGSDLVV